jgi:hypothetical protein
MSLTQKLAATEAETEDEFIRVLILNRLGDKYDPMIIAMEISGIKISSYYVYKDNVDTKITSTAQTSMTLYTRHQLLILKERNRLFRHGLCAKRRDKNLINIEKKKRKTNLKMKGEKEDKTKQKAKKLSY